MPSSKWSPKTLTRYILLQLPLLVVLVVLFIISFSNDSISTRFILVLIILDVLKDVILYPFVWESYRPNAQKGKHPMIGLTGVVTEQLDPAGYIRVRGELWQAQAEGGRKIKKGEKVIVTHCDGLLLTVKPNRKNVKKSGSPKF